MSGSPVKRQRRADAARLAAGRAGSSDVASRRWAVERAAVVGDEVAAREAGVSRGTIRSWRARLKAEGSLSSGGSSVKVAPVEASPSVPVVAAGGEGSELGRAERELREVRQARDESLARSRALQTAGNDISAVHAGRLARDHASAARALAGEVALLREANPRLDAAGSALLVDVMERFVRGVGLPWSQPLRKLLGELVRADNGRGELPSGVAGDAEREVRRYFARVFGQAEVEVADARRSQDSTAGNLESAPPLAELPLPEPWEGVAEVAADEGEPLALCALWDVPSHFRGRFALGDEGDERARRAWSERLRDEGASDDEKG